MFFLDFAVCMMRIVFDPCVLYNVVSEEYTYIYMTAIRKDELAWLHAHKNNGNIKILSGMKKIGKYELLQNQTAFSTVLCS